MYLLLEEYSAKGGARKKKGKTANKENTDAPKTETGDSGKKNKFVPLYNKDGKGNVIQLAGRHVCECQAGIYILTRTTTLSHPVCGGGVEIS